MSPATKYLCRDLCRQSPPMQYGLFIWWGCWNDCHSVINGVTNAVINVFCVWKSGMWAEIIILLSLRACTRGDLKITYNFLWVLWLDEEPCVFCWSKTNIAFICIYFTHLFEYRHNIGYLISLVINNIWQIILKCER